MKEFSHMFHSQMCHHSWCTLCTQIIFRKSSSGRARGWCKRMTILSRPSHCCRTYSSPSSLFGKFIIYTHLASHLRRQVAECPCVFHTVMCMDMQVLQRSSERGVCWCVRQRQQYRFICTNRYAIPHGTPSRAASYCQCQVSVNCCPFLWLQEVARQSYLNWVFFGYSASLLLGVPSNWGNHNARLWVSAWLIPRCECTRYAIFRESCSGVHCANKGRDVNGHYSFKAHTNIRWNFRPWCKRRRELGTPPSENCLALNAKSWRAIQVQ